MKYLTSFLRGSASDAFMSVLDFHLDGSKVLDLTYGQGLSWKPNDLFRQVELVKADIADPPDGSDQVKQDCFTAFEDRPEWRGAFDMVYFDPPYMVDVSRSDDPREGTYGGYGISLGDLAAYQDFVPHIHKLLRNGGKVIIKCGDQYHIKSRRLMLHHLRWCRVVESAFDIVDFFVYKFWRISPTAFQVKDRPSSIVSHTYFIVGQRESWMKKGERL